MRARERASERESTRERGGGCARARERVGMLECLRIHPVVDIIYILLCMYILCL